MPANIIASFAQKSGKSEAEVEKLWNQAKKEAEDATGVDDVYAYATGILKKMLSIQENIHMEINESNLSVENIYNLIDDIVESLLEQRKRKTPNIATLKAIATSLTNNLKGVSISESVKVGDRIKIKSPYKSPKYGKIGNLFATVKSISNGTAKINVYDATYSDDIPKDGMMIIPIEDLPSYPLKENVDMSKQEQRRDLTRQFIKKVVDGQKFDATVDLKEMIRLSKEIRYDDLAASVEI